tara:strand:+ start:141 stop:500 length:360 start_codon:yes stop_codon:yes gene_type:complete
MLTACSDDFSQLDFGNTSPTKNSKVIPEEVDVTETTRFKTEQLRKLQIGLISDDVEKILGKPDDISKQTCGVDGFFYKCTIWRYEDANQGLANLFFNGDFKRLYLIKFDIKKLGELVFS